MAEFEGDRATENELVGEEARLAGARTLSGPGPSLPASQTALPSRVREPLTAASPTTSSFAVGDVVPTPTPPATAEYMLSPETVQSPSDTAAGGCQVPVPSASLVAIAIILSAIGLPIEALGVLLVFDRILDMARTSINVWGDTCCATIVARLEGEQTNVALGEPEREPA